MYSLNKVILAHQNPDHFNVWVFLGSHIDMGRARLLQISRVARHQAMFTNGGVNSLKIWTL